MKIIGKTETGFIAELTQGDLAALVGESYFSGEACVKKMQDIGLKSAASYHGASQVVVGATIDLSGRFSRVTQLEYKHTQLQGTAKTLREMADLMEHLGNAVIVPPEPEAK